MSVAIAKTHSASSREWDLTWLECPYSTYFHSREWAEIWNVYTRGNFSPAARVVTFADGKTVLLTHSVQTILGGVAQKCISSPGGTFGGWVSSSNITERHAELLAHHLSSQFSSLYWRLNPYDPVAIHLESPSFTKGSTQTCSLDAGFEAVRREWSKGHRAAERQASREHVTVRLAETRADWLAYYDVYRDSLRRWGDRATSAYDWKFFEIAYHRKSPRVRLWLAMHQGSMIAGALCLYAPKHVAYWHGAALAKYFPLRPVNLLVSEAMKHACESGYSWFDFNPSGGHAGVKAFKKGFGAIELPAPVLHRESRTLRIAAHISDVSEKIERRLAK